MPDALRAACQQRPVDPLVGLEVKLLAWQPVPWRAPVGRHHRVPRDAQHGDLATTRRDVHDHDRVRAVAADTADVLDVAPGAGVRAKQQDVERAGIALWPVAEVYLLH